MEILTPEEIVESFKSTLGNNLSDSKIYQTEAAIKKNLFTSISLYVKLEGFRNAMKHMCELQEHPHFIVISPNDRGDIVELIYHAAIYYGQHLKEISLLLSVSLPKNNLKIPTITDIIPAAIYAEREVQEMMGVEIVGIPDNRRLFLPDDFPEGVYPWRQDETGPEKMLRVLPGRKGIQHG